MRNEPERCRLQGPAPTLRLTLSLLLAVMAFGCTRPVSVDSTWREGLPRQQSFSNVLVVGVTSSYNTRCRFERVLAASLRSPSVKATASCSLMRKSDPLTREGVAPIIASLGADAVLATELVDRKVKMVEGGTEDTRGESYYKATGYGYAYGYGYYGSYGLPVTYVDFRNEESLFSMDRTVVIATALYETSEASLVYDMRTTARDMKTRDDVLDAVTLAVADRLRRDGLVR